MKTKDKRRDFSVACDHDHLPELSVSQEWLDEAHEETFGPKDERRGVSLMAFCDSPWSHLFEEFHRQRIVHVLSNNTLLLRYQYDYEVDLDRIHSERDLLAWTHHLCGKTWMNTERLSHFIEAVARIKGFKVHGGL
jgi:hypothetical protein